jgi:hypothetical protein
VSQVPLGACLLMVSSRLLLLATGAAIALGVVIARQAVDAAGRRAAISRSRHLQASACRPEALQGPHRFAPRHSAPDGYFPRRCQID